MPLKPRDLALAALSNPDLRPGATGRYLDREFRNNPGLSERDRALALNLVQGVQRWRLRLDWTIEQAARFPFKKIEPPVLDVLRIALYQILFLDRVPDAAAVNEAVIQSKRVGRSHTAGVVNGILRAVCRTKNKISFPDRRKEPVRFLSVFYSYPIWLVEKWIRELGRDTAERLLMAGNEIPRLVLRGNTLKVDRHELISRLETEGLTGRATRFAPEGVEVESPHGPVGKLESFRDGLFQVQGEAAQVCAHLLAPQPGERIVDMCAGLGGKSTHLGQIVRDRGLILAVDADLGKLLKLRDNAGRLGIGCVRPLVADAARPMSPLFSGPMDRIFVDAPCSGLGVISKHPDGKWVRGEEDILRLSLLQRRILGHAVPLLRKGGRLLYVTCTISKEENEGVVDDFLKRHTEMAVENLRHHVPAWARDLICDEGFLKTFPAIHGMDGFFGALFTRK